jgi:hypothetical protein
MKKKGYGVNILSVLNGQLLVSRDGLFELYVMSENGDLLSTVKVSEELRDASWTPGGNIVYTTARKVVAMTPSGTVMTETEMKNPRMLSVSTDDVIYLADFESGVYESRDEGVSWSKVLESGGDGWGCWEVIKVKTSDDCDDLWTLENKSMYGKWVYRVRVYSVKRGLGEDVSVGEVVEVREVRVRTSEGREVELNGWSRLAYDGKRAMLLSEWSDRENKKTLVDVLSSVRGEYLGLLLCIDDEMDERVFGLAVDVERDVVYVGYGKERGGGEGKVGVFKMTYDI